MRVFKDKLIKIKLINKFYKRCVFVRDVTLPLFILNILFQRVFRLDGKLRYMKHYTSRVIFPKGLHIENRSGSILRSLAVSGGCYIQALGGVYIGEGTIWGPRVTIISQNHDLNDFNKSYKKEEVRIGKNCWLGAGSVILPGVILGEKTIVGANSVVTKSFPDGNCVLAGVPAQVVKKIND